MTGKEIPCERLKIISPIDGAIIDAKVDLKATIGGMILAAPLVPFTYFAPLLHATIKYPILAKKMKNCVRCVLFDIGDEAWDFLKEKDKEGFGVLKLYPETLKEEGKYVVIWDPTKKFSEDEIALVYHHATLAPWSLGE